MTLLRGPWVLSAAMIMVLAACSGPTTPEPVEPEVAAIITLDTISTFSGEVISIPIQLTYPPNREHSLEPVGAFRLSIAYDDRVLTYLGSVQPGDAISGWEHFTAQHSAGMNTSIYLPAKIRIEAIRDLDNGESVDPPQSRPEGTLATLRFVVSSDWTYLDTTTVLSFKSAECGDNVLQPSSSLDHYYIALPQYEGDEAALTDTLACPRRISLEPLIGFERGSVTILYPPPEAVGP